jgi:hypothetical protein
MTLLLNINKPILTQREFYAFQIRTSRAIIRDFRRVIANPKTTNEMREAAKLHSEIHREIIQECREKLGY